MLTDTPQKQPQCLTKPIEWAKMSENRWTFFFQPTATRIRLNRQIQ